MHEKAAQFQTGPHAPLRLGLGLATGPVVAGLTGSRRVSCDLWGPTVALAWRLSEQAPPGRILVSASTQTRLPAEYLLETAESCSGLSGGSAATSRLLAAGRQR